MTAVIMAARLHRARFVCEGGEYGWEVGREEGGTYASGYTGALSMLNVDHEGHGRVKDGVKGVADWIGGQRRFA